MTDTAHLEQAHQAGRAAFLSEPPYRRHPDSCPFDPRDEADERAAWLAGFEEALDDTPPVYDLRAALEEAQNA